MKKAGVLLAISSLPSNYGIGDFGENCYRLIRDLKKAGFKYWQILPLNPLGYGNSPYQGYSSKAMDEIYISLDELIKEGLIRKTKKFNATRKSVDYQAVRSFKTDYYKEAYHNFKEDREFKKFSSLQWVQEYAVFMTLKKKNNMQIWNEWQEDERNWVKDKNLDLSYLQEEIRYEVFLQYILLKQWKKIKEYANHLGIEIIGDLPIYVGMDSVDVWANQSCFLLDDKSHPIFIAGVPPDYFSETGQRWGNPIYDWEYLEEHDFDFWIDRLGYSTTLYDYVRIDHFRAFDTYWKIPSTCPTAIEGEWVEAPGYELFDLLFEKYPNLNIIAEDLGNLRPEVLELRDHYGLAGMEVLQFTFNPMTPYANEKENVVLYTGTHDNTTTLNWFNSQNASFKRKTKVFFDTNGYHQKLLTEQFIAFALNSKANTVILPMQDILNLSSKSRMNTPGTSGSPNWEWKMNDFKDFEKKINFLHDLITTSKR